MQSMRRGGQEDWDGSVASTRVTTAADRTVEDLANTPAYVRRLHRKLRQGFMQRGANGIPALLPAVRNIDAPCDHLLGVWEVKALLRNEGLKLSDRELEVLFHLHDYDGAGEVRLDMLLAELRLTLCCTQQQVEDLMRVVRARLREQRLPTVFAGIDPHDDQLLHCGLFVKHTRRMRSACGFTPSDIVFLFCCFEHEGVVSTRDFLAAAQPPDDARKLQNALLKLQNACEDPDRTHAGCVGLGRVLRRTGGADRLGADAFLHGMKNFGCGLRDGEVELLFEALQDDDGMVGVATLTGILQQKPLPASPERVEELLRQLNGDLTSKTPYGLVLLKLSLLERFNAEKQAYVDSLHASHPRGVVHLPASRGGSFEDGAADCYLDVHCIGDVLRDHVPARSFDDLGIEAVFNQFSVPAGDVAATRRRPLPADDIPTMVVGVNALVNALRGPIPPARADLLKQAWNAVDPEAALRVPYRAHFLKHFAPEATPDVQEGVVTKEALLAHLDAYQGLAERHAAAAAGGEAAITQDTFLAFFGDYSAGVRSDDAFRVTLWEGFGVNRRRRASPHEAKYRAPVTPPPTQESAREQTARKMHEEEAWDAVNPTTDEYHRRHHNMKADHHTVSPPPYRQPAAATPSEPASEVHAPPALPSPEPRAAASAAGTPPPSGSPSKPTQRFKASQGFGGGRSTLNLFGGDEAPPPSARRAASHVDPASGAASPPAAAHGARQGRPAPQQQSVAQSFTGSLRATNAAGRRQLHTERPF